MLMQEIYNDDDDDVHEQTIVLMIATSMLILKTFSIVCCIDCVYIYIYCRKCNAEYNKLIKIIGHCARVFEK